MRIKKKQFFNGNEGRVYINGLPLLSVIKASVKKTIKYETIPQEDGGEAEEEVGHSYEANFTFKSTGTERVMLNGNEEIMITVMNKNMNGTILQHLRLEDFTPKDITLFEFERGKIQEEEFSGKIRKVKDLLGG